MSESNEVAKRPAFLTVLCILSFIAAGFGIIGMILMITARGVVDAAGVNVSNTLNNELAKVDQSLEGLDKLKEATAQVSAVFSWPYIIIGLLLILIGLWAVIKMWKLQKQGYFIYAGTQVIGVILPLVFGLPFSIFGAVMAALFVVLYGVNLKHMS